MLLFARGLTTVRTRVIFPRLTGRGHVGSTASGRLDFPTAVGTLGDSYRASIITRARAVPQFGAALSAAHILNFHSAVGACVFH